MSKFFPMLAQKSHPFPRRRPVVPGGNAIQHVPSIVAKMNMKVDFGGHVSNPTKELQRYSNAFARKNGCGKATKITVFDQLSCPVIGERVRPGYRKKTNGEYIRTWRYLMLSRLKNLYYQNAQTEVVIPMDVYKNFEQP